MTPDEKWRPLTPDEILKNVGDMIARENKPGALAVLQAHVAEYEFDGEIAQAVADVAELLAELEALREKLRSCEEALQAVEADRDALAGERDALRDEISIAAVWRRRCERLEDEAGKYRWLRARMDAGMVSMIVNIEPDDNDETSFQVDAAIASAIDDARAEGRSA